MFPMNRAPLPVVVEYDSRGQRVRKTFSDAYQSRSFYVRMDKEHRNPRIVAAGDKIAQTT